METTEHYLFKCSNFNEERNKILNSPNRLYYNLSTMKYGCTLLKGENVDTFFNDVQNYIIETNRF